MTETNNEVKNDEVGIQIAARLLLVGSPSIEIPEISALVSDPRFGVVRFNQDPRASAEVTGSFRSVPSLLEGKFFDVVYCDNDITRYFWFEGSAYISSAYRLTKEGGVFVCSCYDVSFISRFLEEGNLHEQLEHSDGKGISAVEILYGTPVPNASLLDIYSMRNSVYNLRTLGELAISCGFSDAFVVRRNTSELLLVALRGKPSSSLPERFTHWLDEAFAGD